MIPKLQLPAQHDNLQSHHDGGTGNDSQYHVSGDGSGARVLVIVLGVTLLATLGGSTTLSGIGSFQAALAGELTTLNNAGRLKLVEGVAVDITSGLEVEGSTDILEGIELNTTNC